MANKRKKVIAIIPARGGSKRIPRKNIRKFLGKPLIQYSIDAAKSSGLFDEVMVSTDSEAIAKVAIKSGATVPFLRSETNSNENASLADVLVEVLTCYKERGREFDLVCCILPSPIFSCVRIRYAHNLILRKKADSVMLVTKFDFPIERAIRITDQHAEMINPENMFRRSQEFEPFYHDAGRFYWLSVPSFMKHKSFFMGNTIPLPAPSWEIQDIDTLEDWNIAEAKYKLKQYLLSNASPFIFDDKIKKLLNKGV